MNIVVIGTILLGALIIICELYIMVVMMNNMKESIADNRKRIERLVHDVKEIQFTMSSVNQANWFKRSEEDDHK